MRVMSKTDEIFDEIFTDDQRDRLLEVIKEAALGENVETVTKIVTDGDGNEVSRSESTTPIPPEPEARRWLEKHHPEVLREEETAGDD